MKSLTKIEENRLVECLFYLYFKNFSLDVKKTNEFWTMINYICLINKINNKLIIGALRTLMESTNTPQDKEIVYLCNSAGFSVRDVNNIAGIYWQRQKPMLEEFKKGIYPKVTAKVTDVLAQAAMRKFIKAIYNISGIFNILDLRILEKNI